MLRRVATAGVVATLTLAAGGARVAAGARVATGAFVAGGAHASPTAATGVRLRSQQKLSPAYNQGIARAGSRWVVTGINIIGIVDDKLHEKKSLAPAIPRELTTRAFNHIGDPDVVGNCIYAPLEEPNYNLGQQVTARYDATTLHYVDSVTLAQHENSFVTVDPTTGIAYTMDHFSGSALLRYDVLHAWAPMPPLTMSKYLYKVQGAAVGAGAVWLATSDTGNPMYRVDLATGQVTDLGSAGHEGGEGEGVAVAPLGRAYLHPLTVDPKLAPVWLGHFSVATVTARAARPGKAKKALGACHA
jgi:hypothetical protein